MKDLSFIFFLLIGISIIISCDDGTTPPIEPEPLPDFKRSEYRIGYWKRTEREDSIQFVNDSIYITRSSGYEPNIYDYYIEGDTIFDRERGVNPAWGWDKDVYSFDKETEILSIEVTSPIQSEPNYWINYKKLW